MCAWTSARHSSSSQFTSEGTRLAANATRAASGDHVGRENIVPEGNRRAVRTRFRPVAASTMPIPECPLWTYAIFLPSGDQARPVTSRTSRVRVRTSPLTGSTSEIPISRGSGGTNATRPLPTEGRLCGTASSHAARKTKEAATSDATTRVDRRTSAPSALIQFHPSAGRLTSVPGLWLTGHGNVADGTAREGPAVTMFIDLLSRDPGTRPPDGQAGDEAPRRSVGPVA